MRVIFWARLAACRCRRGLLRHGVSAGFLKIRKYRTSPGRHNAIYYQIAIARKHIFEFRDILFRPYHYRWHHFWAWYSIYRALYGRPKCKRILTIFIFVLRDNYFDIWQLLLFDGELRYCAFSAWSNIAPSSRACRYFSVDDDTARRMPLRAYKSATAVMWPLSPCSFPSLMISLHGNITTRNDAGYFHEKCGFANSMSIDVKMPRARLSPLKT